MAEGRLYRSRNAVVGGVCAGIAKRIDADAIVVRILAILLTCVTFGLAGIVYLYLWARLPLEEEGPELFEVTPESAESSSYGFVDCPDCDEDSFRNGISTFGGNGLPLFVRLAVAACLMLLFLVVSMNLSPLLPGTKWWQFWPLAFMMIGLCLIIVPVPGRHEVAWHALGIVITSVSAMALPMVLHIASWNALLNAVVVMWPLLLLAVILLVAGIVMKQNAFILMSSVAIAVFCLLATNLFVSDDVTRVMAYVSYGDKIFFMR